ncbi:MAG TPA: sugar kinase [Chloroflexota bacterium]|nr:sugar kinase [Chloroflexota bacterium]
MPYHFVSFGEAMVRLCPPGFGRVEMATSLEMQPGGAELNTAVGIARLGLEHGLRTAWVSRLPQNPLGRYLANKGREHGVSTDEIVWDSHPDARCGTYFLEEGAAPRASSVIYDRANSAFARLSPEELDWPRILEGARYFLVTGITPALSPGCLEATHQSMRAARAAGAKVVFDPNFRSKLWSIEAARAVYQELAPLVDILSCSAEGLRAFYGIASQDSPARAAIETFDLQAVVMTSREELGMWKNRIGATVVARDAHGQPHTFQDREREVEIVDRLGAGDAFLAGFLTSLLYDGGDWQRATEWGGAAAALKHSIRGDFPILTAAEIKQEIESPALRIQR